ncbi:ABC transporter permease [Sutcliffiella horikoshii]|uniref:ABC transporter permease n=1 Tax=Sutcliffiella horikoshii TaxID=79883 RepID=A0ABN4ZEH2_9BACI|nr:ABC transporter permease [Sutcliffiella horikoshii]ART76717.1 ABC transporter permease [Sutcliffiella horikoshii]
MINLIRNEMLKLLRKKRLYVIILIIAFLVPLFTYAQFKEIQEQSENIGNQDWRTVLQQEITETQNQLSSNRIQDEWRKFLKIRLSQQQYYLENDIDPRAPGAPTFMRIFAENSIDLVLPLLVMIIVADLVSSEASSGTIKLLLTRPVKRWRILLSKYLAMVLSISFIVLSVAVLSYGISGIVFGYGGWNMPLLTGFSISGDELVTTNVHIVPQWQFILMEFGLVWYVCLIVGTLTFMLSVLLRSTATVMGIMLSSLIAGAILANMVSSWESAKYLFILNLDLTNYISGIATPIEGMTLGFSMSVLAVWGIAGLIIAFVTFSKRDIY